MADRPKTYVFLPKKLPIVAVEMRMTRFLRHLFLTSAAVFVPSIHSGMAAAADFGLRLNLFENPGTLFARADLGTPFSLVMVGVTVFATTISLMHMRARRKWQQHEASQQSKIGELELVRDRAELFLNAEPQLIISWRGDEPEISGDLSIIMDAPIPRRVLGFGSWLPPEQAKALEKGVDLLRQKGERFKLSLKANNGHHIEAEGHAITGRAVLRLRDVSGDRLSLLRLEVNHTRVSDEANALKVLLNTAPQAAWLRDRNGDICWVNAAYADAVEAGDSAEAVARKIELLERDARNEASKLRAEGKIFKSRVQTVIAGKRRMLDVIETPTAGGSVGIVADMTEVEAVRADLETQREAHRRTLNNLPIAIASFDRTKRLNFHNQAYVELWKLDPEFLKIQPTDGEILDRLRAGGQLPEQADFRSWKANILEAYRSVETRELWWSLPDGRHLRVVASPNPLGGVTYLFDDLTERYSLQSRVQSMTKVQDETLDSLREGVAVFGSDGRLKLGNPAFAELFDMDRANFGLEPHIDQVIDACKQDGSRDAWQQMRTAITGFNDARMPTSRRLKLGALKVDATTIPLSDGATLVNLVDVTVNVRVEQALRERNDALENASRFKTSFIKNVSFELRSPLTSVIGFGQALAAGTAGPLSDRQQDYADHIMQSSEALLTLIDDILDIASIDAGTLELELADVDLKSIVDQTCLDLQTRLSDNTLSLAIDIPSDIGEFIADGRRLRQILYNLLSNSIDFSGGGASIFVSATSGSNDVMLHVRDVRHVPVNPQIAGPIDSGLISAEAESKDILNRGAGLRLSVVRSLVELHGGEVRIISSSSSGTEVVCKFPRKGTSGRVAAE